MAKRTKTQKRRLVTAVELKSKQLWLEGLISTKALETIERALLSARNKLK